MASLKSLFSCIGVDPRTNGSVLRDLFGFIQARVPTDPNPSVKASVSILEKMRSIEGKHVHLNIIRVGFDALSDFNRASALANIDYATYRAQNIYRQVNLGVGRVLHWAISAQDSAGRDDLGNEDEADALSEEWSVLNDGLDVFIVRNISSGQFVGKSTAIGGNCDKDGKDDGLVGGGINVPPPGNVPGLIPRNLEDFSRTFAHEIGHFLGLEHNHDGDSCPTSTAEMSNLMAQSKCVIKTAAGASDTRNSVVLNNSQGEKIRDHCAVKNGC